MLKVIGRILATILLFTAALTIVGCRTRSYEVEVVYENGSVEGYGTYEKGETVTLTAEAAEGYAFDGWSGDFAEEDATLEFEMPGNDVSLTAHFVPREYNVAVEYDSEKGTVEGYGVKTYGDTVELTATPSEGYTFAEWTGDFTGDAETLEFTMPAEDVELEAHFTPEIHTVSVTYDSTAGTVEGYGEIAYGETVVLTATPEEGYTFAEWTGDFTGDAETLEFTMPAEDVEIEAHFSPRVYTVTVAYDETRGTVEGYGEVTYGETVMLTATPEEGYKLEEWTGDFTGDGETLEFTMPAEDVTIEALFEAKNFAVEVIYDDEKGAIEGYGEIRYNETVTLTVVSKEGYLFDGWTGYLESSDKTITFVMPAENIVLEAHFVEAHTVTVDYDSDEGSILGYEGKFRVGETVELTAVPATGYEFDGWSGYLESDEETITFEMPAEDVAFSVAFSIIYYDLTITQVGEGQVRGEGTYNYGDTVTLEATSASGWRFIEWRGDISSNEADFTFSMPAEDIEIEALFKEVYTVTIFYDAGRGSIDPAVPREYVEGETVTLEALAKEGYAFDGWSGDFTGDDEILTFTMPADDVFLTAEFIVALFTVTVDYDEERGSITGEGTYEFNEEVTLEAIPEPGYKFVEWRGDLESTDSTFTFEMPSHDVTLEAVFAREAINTVADILAMDDGDTVEVEAVVSSYRAYSKHRQFFIQDEDGTGIYVYDDELFDDESLAIGNKIVIEGELDTYEKHGNDLRQLRNVTLIDNDGGNHPVTVIDDQTIDDIMNTYPDNTSMRFRLHDVVISDIDPEGDNQNNFLLETGEETNLKFHFGSYGQHFVDILEVGDTIEWIEFTLHDLHYGEIRLEGVVFPELDEDMLEAVADRDIQLPGTTTSDLTLPDMLEIEGVDYDRGLDLFDVTWDSDEPAYIADDGTVNRPGAGEDDVTVTLTATITDSNNIETVINFNVTVLAEDDSTYTQIYYTDFDTTKASYAPDTRTFNGIEWMLYNAVTGTLANDKTEVGRAARITINENNVDPGDSPQGYIEPLTSFSNAAKIVFTAAYYGTDSSVSMKIEISPDGEDWYLLDAVNSLNYNLTHYEYIIDYDDFAGINEEDSIYIRITNTSNPATSNTRRLNIDEFWVYEIDENDNGNDNDNDNDEPVEGEVTVHYIDVGQADATFIQGPNYNILIDAGRTHYASQNNTIPYLLDLGIEKIDLVIGTHPHMDHIGDIDVVLDKFEVGKVWKSGYVHDTATYDRVRAAIDAAEAAGEIEYHEPRFGHELILGQKNIRVLNPVDGFTDIHDASISVKVIFGDVTFLFTGDAEDSAEQNMIDNTDDHPWSLDADVYQAGHHGSYTSSTLPFMNAMMPSTTIYSAGGGYDHPHQEFLDNVDEVGSALYGTDVNGTIIVTTDGLSYQVEPESGEAIMSLRTDSAEADTEIPYMGYVELNQPAVLPEQRRETLFA